MYVLKEDVFQEKPVFTKFAFARLLEWLDEDIDSHGERYLEIRRRLVEYFDRRNRPSADELADETLSRVARTLEQSGAIATRPPARYCYVVARFVLLEDFRKDRRHVPIDESPRIDMSRAGSTGPAAPDSGYVIREQRLECLDPCLQKLRPEQRELAVEYFRDSGRQRIERRRELARRLGITMNALGIRAFRIRDTLMTCVEACRHQRRQI